MTVLKKWYRYGYGALNIIPANMVLGLSGTASIHTDWVIWTDADSRFLLGATGDGDVATTINVSGISRTVGSAGGHGTSGGTTNVANYAGDDAACSTGCRTPKRNTSSRGSHGSHSLSISHTPAMGRLRLIKATTDTVPPIGAVMFGDDVHDVQSPYTTLSNYYIGAGSTTGIVSSSTSAGTTSSISDSHIHIDQAQGQASYISTNMSTSVGTAGGSHSHSGGSPSISLDLKRAAYRAFEIISEKGIHGLIGMWPHTGIPPGWEFVAGMSDRYLFLDSSGTGAQAGNNTISVSGTTGSNSHAHAFSGASGGSNARYTPIYHPSGVSHTHSYSGSSAYRPNSYRIKFLRYIG